MEASGDDPQQGSDTAEAIKPRYRSLSEGWRVRYEGSFVQDFVRGLGTVDFGDRILVFGACMLLSVLPLIIVLSAYASHRIEDDIAQHLGLSAQGDRVVEGLFKSSDTSFHLAAVVGILLSLAGTIAVGRSVEVIYERAFNYPPLPRGQGWLRCTVWVVGVTAVAIGDAAVGKSLRDDAGPLVFALVEVVGFTLFFWWSIHFLLGGRESWRGVRPAAITTALFWIGLGVFAAFYFSTTIVDDSKTYGPIGVTFTLVTWFIAMGSVLTLGAVVGAAWQRRRSGPPTPST